MRRMAAWAVAALTGALLGCESLPTGPSLAAVSIAEPALRATTGHPGVCCCRVTTTATNSNSVVVDVTVTFAAFNVLQREPFASIVFFVPALRQRESRAIDASGFLVPCDAIARVQYEFGVKGLGSPAR